MKHTAFTLILVVVTATTAFANQSQVEKSLQGLSEVKIVCDVNVGDPELLLSRMYLLDETYSQLLDRNIRPVIVVAFRGKASKFITAGEKYVAPENRKTQMDMKRRVTHFAEMGFTLEQCAFAAKVLKLDTADFLPQVTVVENGFLSIVGYQNQGYALLPMD